ncbi:HAD-IA family hydrolase [Pseudodonghicola flavimaris]|uniref:HAD-IA family hydrolase n=1 Tax=Pseudodonghicola flavimaris TaxID=3050036 RepID=A0ABT7F264_9RHOB|nr:HAD-IA family hydrolase [Pseudodonghicola flavimaris]MDK3018700.1 HAD-IA family hydrolase [Pseudodonghicola flavimaris]
MSLRLAIFDVDGTLVDSQAAIVAAMEGAFGGAGLPVPSRAAILSIVGLSLDHAMLRLVPEAEATTRAGLVDGYKATYHANRLAQGAAHSPLFPGAREMLEALNAQPDTLLAVATGKSRRGLDALIEAHGLEQLFISRQVADDHPSKPHPSMIEAALADAGVGPAEAVMIGDTTYDMDMARAAGVPGLGVGWGYHPVEALAPTARRVIAGMDDLVPALEDIWKDPT